MERVGSVLQKDLDNALVAAGARQAQRSVVVVGRGAVHLGAALQQERDGGEVAGPGRLHQRRPPALALVLQLGAVLQQQVGHLGVTVLAGVGQGSVTGRSLGVHLGAGLQEVPAVRLDTSLFMDNFFHLINMQLQIYSTGRND